MTQQLRTQLKKTTRRKYSWHRKVAYGSLVSFAVFLTVEVVLACLGVQPTLTERDPYVGFESSIAVFEEDVDDGSVMRTSVNKRPFFNQQSFSKIKPRGCTRIFCLGGSTTYGRPYDDRTSFPAWLREMLSAADSTRRWEVINAGGISYASYRVAAVMEELCAYAPDVFIVYTGHNEFLEERTYEDIKRQAPAIRRLTTLLHRTRAFSLLDSLYKNESRQVLSGDVDAILDHSIGPASYHRELPLREDVLAHFEFNLSRMVDIARSAGAEIVLVTPAANHKDFSPFKSEHRADLTSSQLERWSNLIDQAEACENNSQPAEAYAIYEQAEQIDDLHADLHFRMGRVLLARNRHNEARVRFRRAIDEDICPLRALSEIPAIVESTAVKHQVPLVDFASILESDCVHHHGHPLLGNEYFVDHVHPTIDANRLLATALVEAMIQRGLVHAEPDWLDQVGPLAAKRIGSRVDAELQVRALTNLAQVLNWAGKRKEAGEIAVTAVDLHQKLGTREDPETLFYAAMHYAMKGVDIRAIELLRKVVQLEPNNAQARWRLKVLLADQTR